MKLLRILGALACLSLLFACGDTPREDDGTGTTPGDGGSAGTTPTPTSTTSLSLQVSAMSLDGNLGTVPGAKVYILPYSSPEAAVVQPHAQLPAEPTGTTDANGIVTIPVEHGQRYVAHVVAENHGAIMRQFEPQENDELFFPITLMELQTTVFEMPETGSVDVTLGNSMGGTGDFVTLTIEAGDLSFNTDTASSALRLKQSADEGEASGEIEIRTQIWDPFVDPPSALPSDLSDDEGGLLASYGMFSIEFFKDGVPVNVTPGETVGWSMKLNEGFSVQAARASSEQHLNSYSMDGLSGIWIKDDNSPTYDTDTREFQAESRHFSHKNCDDPGPYNCNGCVNVGAVNECGDAVTDRIGFEVAGSSSGNGGGCHNLPSALSDPSRAETLSGNVRATHLDFRNNVQSDTANYSTSCDDNGSTGCGTNSCANLEFTFDTKANQGEACSTRDDCGCAQGVDQNLACIGGVCDICRGIGEVCESDENCCRAAEAGTNGDLVCEDLRCAAP